MVSVDAVPGRDVLQVAQHRGGLGRAVGGHRVGGGGNGRRDPVTVGGVTRRSMRCRGNRTSEHVAIMRGLDSPGALVLVVSACGWVGVCVWVK